MASIGGEGRGGGEAFLRADVGGKLKISPAARRGSKEVDAHTAQSGHLLLIQ